MSVRVRPIELNKSIMWPKVKKIQIKTLKSKNCRVRPETATLDKPRILDPEYTYTLDMTRTNRERLATIHNLIATPKKQRGKNRVKEKAPVSCNSNEDDSSCVDEPKPRKISKALNSTYRIRSHVRGSLRESSNLQVLPAFASRLSKSPSPVFKTKAPADRVNLVPSPCSTCERKDQPERLHAHPKRIIKKKLKDDQENNEIQQKNTVTKPVAIKFRSGKSKARPSSEPEVKKEVTLIRKETFKIESGNRRNLPVVDKNATVSPFKLSTKTSRSPVPKKSPVDETRGKDLVISVPKNPVVHSASLRRPRTVVCYLCSKEFFVSSFPLHEPHCLQKWQRANAELPAHLQVSLPQKPDVPLVSEEWKKYAWEAAKAVLVRCENCQRTFLPARLEAHMRSCSSQARAAKKPREKRLVQSDSEKSDKIEMSGPPTVHCHICGRVFSAESISQHEDQCLKRWQQENKSSKKSTPASSNQSTPRRRFVMCYICGRQFGSKSIEIHEPQCLRKWHVENDKLPATQRRQEPQKPEVVYDLGEMPAKHDPPSNAPTLAYRCVVSFINGGQFGTTSVTVKVPRAPLPKPLEPRRTGKGKIEHRGFVFD